MTESPNIHQNNAMDFMHSVWLQGFYSGRVWGQQEGLNGHTVTVRPEALSPFLRPDHPLYSEEASE